jgi:hypothetical protein
MDTRGTLCYFGCGKVVRSDDQTAYRQITAWIHGKKRDGATLRTETGKLAHASCVRKARAGQPPDQESLF